MRRGQKSDNVRAGKFWQGCFYFWVLGDAHEIQSA